MAVIYHQRPAFVQRRFSRDNTGRALEYFFQVPANRIGFKGNGGPFSLVELKVIQEVITLIVFVGFSMLAFKTETLKTNHLIGFAFLILAVYFIFKK